MDRITELLFEEGTAQAPRKQKRKKPNQRFHAAAPSER
jgi:hypothetical protein